MNDKPSKLSTAEQATRRIAAGRAVRPAHDNNGRPTEPPAVYSYDEDGKLVRATGPGDK